MLFLLFAVVAGATTPHRFNHGAFLPDYDEVRLQEQSTFNTSFGDPDRIVFPDQISPANHLMKSLSFAQRMNGLQSQEDFLRLLNIQTPAVVLARVGEPEDERASKTIKAKPALCMPEVQVVPVVENPDPSETYFPNCVRLKRCGGCCNHELLSCQPTHIEQRYYEIQVVRLGPDLQPISNAKRNMLLEEHTACRCDCIKKEKDCTDKQYYLKEECRCNCKNSDEMYKCHQQDEKKYWDPNTCSCHCRKVEECSTNSYFDPNLCSCKSLYSEQWLSDRRTGYNNFRQFGKPRDSQPVIVPLGANDPRRKHKEDPEYK